MPTETEVKNFLQKVVPYNRENGGTADTLALFLSKYGVAIRGVLLNMQDSKTYMHVEYINEGKIHEAKFDIEEIEGRSAEEIIGELPTVDELENLEGEEDEKDS